MKLEYVLCITLPLLMLSLSGTTSTGRPITCNAGTFSRGQPAAVTCNLHLNVSATELGFNVVRYRPTAPKHDIGKDILICEWNTGERKHHCDIQDGYTFNVSQDAFTINIPSVTDESEGLYMCFFVPPDDINSHPCELIVTEDLVSRGSTALPNTTIMGILPKEKCEQSQAFAGLYAALVLLVLALFATLFVFILRRSRSKKQIKKERSNEPMELEQMNPMLQRHNVYEHVPSEDEALDRQMWDCLDEKAKNSLEGSRMVTDMCREVMTLLQKKLEVVFSQEASATIGMFTTLVKSLPTGQEKGQFLVLNLGSSSLRILFVKIKGQEIDSRVSVDYTIPPDVWLGACIKLLNFITNRLGVFVTAKELSQKEISVGLVFSFPCKYSVEHDLMTARPMKWTKECNCDDVLGKEFGKLLQENLKKKPTTGKLTIKVIINDAVGLLMAGVHKDKACRIAFVIGKGVNGCYIKDNGPDSAAKGTTIVTTEWGALGENESLDHFRTEFDRTAVQFSMSPKEQILEKMVGRLYIGDIVRQLLLKLTKDDVLFKSFDKELHALDKKRGFTTEHVLLIDNDMDQDCVLTRDLLVQLQFESIGVNDCKLVKYVCRIVLQRAAYLAAAALATLIQHVKQHEVTVAIDGSLWRYHYRFKQQMMAKTTELVGPEYKVEFLSLLDGSGIGAALTTAVSLHSS